MGEYITKYGNNTAIHADVQSSGINPRRIAKSINISPRTLTKWEGMTNSNFHSEVLRDVAKQFAKNDDSYKPYADEMSAIVKEHNKAGYLTRELSERRNKVDDEMFERIRNEYGEDTYRKIRNVM